MIDPFVLLTPFLLLGVIALLRFVGCDALWGLPGVGPSPPTLAPPPGVYIGPQSVTISDVNANATIYYTTDGTAPSSSTQKYSGLIQLLADTTIRAIASDEYGNSQETLGTYTIIGGLVNVMFGGQEPTTPPNNGPLEVPYKNLNFDGNWSWERSSPENSLNHVYFAPGLTSGTFTFNSGPRRLISMKVSANPAGTITVQDDNSPQQVASQLIPVTTGLSVDVPINWTKKATTITVSFTAQNSIGIDTITYEGPP
jgi:hypothetical protein